jgi:hypothetical protein
MVTGDDSAQLCSTPFGIRDGCSPVGWGEERTPTFVVMLQVEYGGGFSFGVETPRYYRAVPPGRCASF